MVRRFPVNVSMQDIHMFLSFLKENGGEASIRAINSGMKSHNPPSASMLSACEQLKLVKKRKTKVRIVKSVYAKKESEVEELTKTRVRKLQPFPTIIKLLKRHLELSTPDMFEILLKKKLIDYRDTLKELNRFHDDLLKSQDGFKVFDYDPSNDLWSMYGSVLKRHS